MKHTSEREGSFTFFVVASSIRYALREFQRDMFFSTEKQAIGYLESLGHPIGDSVFRVTVKVVQA